MVKANNVPGDPEADPSLWNYTWVNWHDELDNIDLINVKTPEEHGQRQLALLLLMAAGLAIGLIVILIFITCNLVPKHKFVSVVSDPINVINVFKVNENVSPKERETTDALVAK